MQIECEKLRREATLKGESQRFVEQDLDTLRSENEQLRERLIQLETDRANMINDKERKDRECKHLQNEVNRMN
jgi:septal ring factor EnvC (AmiA/AmiB activator)